jgi:molybdopterin/thiamine biosynthesis adenylyltransferase/TusA-related sulfurtransferase
VSRPREEGAPRARGDALVAVVGAGGIGAPCAWALSRAGVGALRVVDFDVVEPSNLPRQILFAPGDVGRPKAAVAAERLASRATRAEGVVARLEASSAAALFAGADVVVDATDGASTKALVHALAVRARIPFVHAAALGAEGRVLDVPAGGRPCLACLFGAGTDDAEGDTCASFGVWPGTAGAVGYLAAAAALDRIARPSGPPRGLRVLDGEAPRAVTLSVTADPACPVCGEAPRPLEGLVPRGARRRTAPAPAVPAGALDLVRESCPMNLLRARRAVDAAAPGSVVEIWLGEEGAASVPEGLSALGHEVVGRDEEAGVTVLRVRRGRVP